MTKWIAFVAIEEFGLPIAMLVGGLADLLQRAAIVNVLDSAPEQLVLRQLAAGELVKSGNHLQCVRFELLKSLQAGRFVMVLEGRAINRENEPIGLFGCREFLDSSAGAS